MRRVSLIFTILISAIVFVYFFANRFSPAPQLHSLADFQAMDRAVWIGVTWSMDKHDDDELEELAQDLITREIDYAFVYVSYLKPGDFFNPTYDNAANFIQQLHVRIPTLRVLSWVGIPVQVITPEEKVISNRLEQAGIPELIADFSLKMVTEMKFDGVHLNIERVPDGDTGFLETLRLVDSVLPDNVILSTTAHHLVVDEPITSIPYFFIPRHWSRTYLKQVAMIVDQVAIMAYDSGLFFPADYRSWMNYQVRAGALALADVDVHFLIGLPTSEEWTASHHVPTETLSNAIFGLYSALQDLEVPDVIDGVSIYPYWETSSEEWQQLSLLP